ncbi:hypothetical protein [Gymnodinialimonas hymeniacidonis]|uniref:hypothetical protein n=1 Tax=Gymnodinialimonas hymeniacidonis TaxID=3126508 RepID=UPI0034C6C6D1
MGVATFRTLLDELDALRASDTPDGDKVVAALAELKHHRPSLPTRDDLVRLFANCNWALEHFAEARIEIPPGPGWRAHWICVELIERTVTDEAARHRSFMNTSVARHLAFGLMHGDKPPKPAPPLPHVPLDLEEATALAAPYLARLEAGIAKAPYSHLKLSWDVLKRPVTPFDTVFENWLADLDARGIGTGNSLHALTVSQALAQIADGGRQVLSWETVEAEILPKLDDPHPMIAACAGKLLGATYSDGAERLRGKGAKSLAQMLEHLTGLQSCRRAAAGGFVAGFDEFGIFLEEAGKDFDLDGWVLAILAHPMGEPYVPGAQAFWFYLHEYYWRDVDFMHRLLDAGHDWVAYMCATEGAELALVRPVLERIVAESSAELAKGAKAFIARAEASA